MSIKKDFLINLLFIFIPFTYIAGNLLLNLNVLLIIIFAFIFYGLQIFKEKLTIVDKLFILLFFYIVTIGVINHYYNNNNPSNLVLVKSISYVRFLLLYFILKFLVQKNIINYKYIFLSFGSASIFVIFDLIVQFYFDKDIFGYVATKNLRRLGGPFGDELIAGSFIQRFFIFSLYFVLLFISFNKEKFYKFSLLLIIAFSFIGIFLAGNRMPIILFLFILILFFLLEKILRKQSIIIMFISLLAVSIPISLNPNILSHYTHFVKVVVDTKDYFVKRFKSEEIDDFPNSYTKDIETGILVWQQNKFVGGGIKSFYFNCAKIKNSPMDKYGGANCNTHPHNYYLQIAAELGAFGLLLVITIFLLIAWNSIKIVLFSSKNTINRILMPFFLVFIAEIFPLKTTGSFFTSANSTFLFIIIAFIVGLLQLEKKIGYEK